MSISREAGSGGQGETASLSLKGNESGRIRGKFAFLKKEGYMWADTEALR